MHSMFDYFTTPHHQATLTTPLTTPHHQVTLITLHHQATHTTPHHHNTPHSPQQPSSLYRCNLTTDPSSVHDALYMLPPPTTCPAPLQVVRRHDRQVIFTDSAVLKVPKLRKAYDLT